MTFEDIGISKDFCPKGTDNKSKTDKWDLIKLTNWLEE
jgi:hypothetical protein